MVIKLVFSGKQYILKVHIGRSKIDFPMLQMCFPRAMCVLF